VPAFAGPDCTEAEEPLMQMWQIAQRFEEAGGKIEQLKVSDGCYEIYGWENEAKVEIYYDPKTGAELERHE
jgi:hypothetical protein